MTIKKTLVVCPYCASGCKIEFTVDVEKNQILNAKGAQGYTNQGELCLKGYYGWEFLKDTRILTPRLTRPLVRYKRGEPFTEVSWDEAIRFASSKLMEIKEKYGPDSIYVTGCARGPGNEANYIAQKFARAVVGTNNVDCCARVCHGPSVEALDQTFGNGSMSNSIPEIEDTKCIMIFGYNPADSHPIVARRIIRAKAKGAKIIVVDPRVTESARTADIHLQMKNGGNVALCNAMQHVLVEENLLDKEFIEKYTDGFDKVWETVKDYTPENTAEITGLDPEMVRKAVRMYAAAETATILWGMGVTQWGQGVETCLQLSNIAAMTGNLAKRNVGVGPVRGQNNVQGSCDMGALPGRFPGYQSVTDPANRAKFEKAWGVEKLPAEKGIPITEVGHNIESGKIKAMYLFGEDPFQTEPDLHAVREAYAKLDLFIAQDIFMTKSVEHADVIFPATSWGEHDGVYSAADRAFQRMYTAIKAPEGTKHDWEIHSLMATAMGYPMHYNNTQEIWDEMRSLCPLFYGATYEKMEGLGCVYFPCRTLDDPGENWMYRDGKFLTPNGRAQMIPATWRPPVDQVDEKFPLVLSTVREVGHYSCRSMTGNCPALTTLADEPGFAQINPVDAEENGIKDQELIWVEGRRGKVITRAYVTERTNRGAIYMTYQWWIGACNELTIEHLDPTAKTPEYKYSAVRIEKIDDQQWAEKYLAEEYESLKARLADAADNVLQHPSTGNA